MFSLKPGMTPLPIVVAYFIIASSVGIVLLIKRKPKYNAVDFAIIGVGGGLTAIINYIVGNAIFLPAELHFIFGKELFLGVFVFYSTVGAVRKVGSGMATVAVYDITSDIIEYGFTGEPLSLIFNVFTYGLMADILIFLTNNKIFGIGEKKDQILLAAFEGGMLGFFFSFIHPFFFMGFFGPLVFGVIPNRALIMFAFLLLVPGYIVNGALSGILVNRISKVVK